jgi:tetratricopeptide (TPR) repeat protein
MQARSFYERCLTRDPENIEALVGVGMVDVSIGVNFFDDSRAGYLATAEASVIKALSMAPQHALAHGVLGLIQIHTNRANDGIAECERAVALDRNLAVAHGWIGIAKVFLGRFAETEAHVQEAIRLSPRDIFFFRWMMFVGLAKLYSGAYAEAVVWLGRSIEHDRNFPHPHFLLASALALLGRLDQAQAAMQTGRALSANFTIRRFRNNVSSNDPTYMAQRERIVEGMRLAGVPEG